VKSDLGAIAGLITVEGKPASGLAVALKPRHAHIVEKAIATASTDAEGRYSFSDVRPGHYWIEVLDRNYVSSDGYHFDGSGRDVSVADGVVLGDVDIQLIKGGVISGRILDSEGRGVSGELVFMLQAEESGPRWQRYLYVNNREPFKTDVNGHYRVYGIPPGRYLVGVGVDIPRITGDVRDRYDLSVTGSVGSDHYYAETFYPGVTDKLQAHVLEVTAGSEFSDLVTIVGKRFRAFTFSGRVIDARTGEPVRNCHIEVGHKAGGGFGSSYQVSGPSDTDSEGRFTKTGYVPGQFFVNARFDDTTNAYGTPVEFEVKEDDVAGLEIKTYRGVGLRGTVYVEGVKMTDLASTISRLKLRVYEDGAGASPLQREAAVAENGSFEIAGMRPGEFEFSIGSSDVSRNFSLLRVERDGQSNSAVPTATRDGNRPSITVGKDGLSRVRVVLAYKVGRIKIHVDVENGKLPKGVRLNAWIGWDRGNDHWSTLPELDANGNFTQEGLAPGEYSVEIGDGMRRFTGKKMVSVAKGDASVSFVVDASKIKPRD
jgi:protocatechuate 3,4-dioxygenase beta subunit